MTQTIIGVAIKYKGIVFKLGAPSRHHDVIRAIHELTGDMDIEGIQGFITSEYKFVSRKQAAEIAYNAGQIDKKKDELFSEDVW